MSEDDRDLRVNCPTCREPKKWVRRGDPYFPFCSPECQDHDLAGWIREQYKVSGPPFEPEPGER